MTPAEYDEALTAKVADFFYDPYGFVLWAFPWGQGDLTGQSPDIWQKEQLEAIAADFLRDPLATIQDATSSGHGIGKSAEVAWIVLWAMNTRPHLAGWVTANTQSQLTKKTWRELSVWHKRCITEHWFTWTATRYYHKQHPETWGMDAIPWTEHNSEAFAGLHAKYVLIIMDEASAVADKIWEVSEGAMTTPRAMWFVYGNPTRNSGRFRECFGKFKHRWRHRKVDSRTAKMTNKTKIAEWEIDHGHDSDFFRVRVRGEFPVTGSNQLISSGAVEKAAAASLHPDVYQYNPIKIGCDVARFGSDETVISVIQGRKHVSMETFQGLDNVQVASKCIAVFNRYGGVGTTLFVDEVGVGAGVVDYLKHLGYPVIPVNVGRAAEDKDRFYNARMEVWYRMKEWLDSGADLVDDSDLKEQLISPEYEYTPKEQMKLEKKDDMKLRGLSSPDRAESIALTFFQMVQPSMVQSSFEPTELEEYM